jgi:hypothetical protein
LETTHRWMECAKCHAVRLCRASGFWWVLNARWRPNLSFYEVHELEKWGDRMSMFVCGSTLEREMWFWDRADLIPWIISNGHFKHIGISPSHLGSRPSSTSAWP